MDKLFGCFSSREKTLKQVPQTIRSKINPQNKNKLPHYEQNLFVQHSVINKKSNTNVKKVIAEHLEVPDKQPKLSEVESNNDKIYPEKLVKRVFNKKLGKEIYYIKNEKNDEWLEFTSKYKIIENGGEKKIAKKQLGSGSNGVANTQNVKSPLSISKSLYRKSIADNKSSINQAIKILGLQKEGKAKGIYVNIFFAQPEKLNSDGELHSKIKCIGNYAPGIELTEFLIMGKRVSKDSLVSASKSMFEYQHDGGFAAHDRNPGNIFVADDGQINQLDFDLDISYGQVIDGKPKAKAYGKLKNFYEFLNHFANEENSYTQSITSSQSISSDQLITHEEAAKFATSFIEESFRDEFIKSIVANNSTVDRDNNAEKFWQKLSLQNFTYADILKIDYTQTSVNP